MERPNSVMPVTQNTSRRSMKIGTVIADGTVLDFLPSRPGKQPLHLVINKLALDGVGKNQSDFLSCNHLRLQAARRNPIERPIWSLESGRSRDARAVTGSYTFRNANLAFFKAISGTLFSTGKFSGILDHIEVAGTTDTPNFQVFNTSHTRRLTTEFHAAVDATGGDTFLENVIGHFDRTTVEATRQRHRGEREGHIRRSVWEGWTY